VIQYSGIVTTSITQASFAYQLRLLATSYTIVAVTKNSTKESLASYRQVANLRLLAVVFASLSCAQEAQLVLQRNNLLTKLTSWLFTAFSFVFASGTLSFEVSTSSDTFSSSNQAIVV